MIYLRLVMASSRPRSKPFATQAAAAGGAMAELSVGLAHAPARRREERRPRWSPRLSLVASSGLSLALWAAMAAAIFAVLR
jgi:hypothetical protein